MTQDDHIPGTRDSQEEGGESARADEANVHVDQGFGRIQEEKFEEAIACFDEAIRRDPENARAFYGRGLAWQDLEEMGNAASDFGKAMRLASADSRSSPSRGSLGFRRGEVEEAGADYKASESETAAIMTTQSAGKRSLISPLIQEHFAPESIDNITITERKFPFRVRADLQRAIDRLFAETTRVVHFCGVKQHYSQDGLDFSSLLVPSPHDPAVSVPPQYEEVDIGDDEPVRCLQNGLWLLEEDSNKFVVLLAPAGHPQFVTGLKFQIATVNSKDGTRIAQQFYKQLEDSVLESESYRGKILSLEVQSPYTGMSSGLIVHRLRTVERNDVILPKKTLDLLDRNVIGFTRQRARLAEYGLSTKKGLLFYGPPGTGKTHTIHYLSKALERHTTFLIYSEQMGMLGEYMTLARLLQPSVVVIEDVDLIARDREQMEDVCEEVLLNKLLNEMDGLRPDADVLFILTTNRPESLEVALSSRPGRIDQAIEFPLPDEGGRAKLIRLYSQGLSVSEDVIQATVKKTESVSASFIKELMRRSAQFLIERNAETPDVTLADIDNALEELLFTGGSLNRKLLGADNAGDDSE